MRKVLRKLEIPMAGLPQKCSLSACDSPSSRQPCLRGKADAADRKEPDSPRCVFKITLIISPPKVIFKLSITRFFFFNSKKRDLIP